MHRMFRITRPFLWKRSTAAIAITTYASTTTCITMCLEEDLQLEERGTHFDLKLLVQTLRSITVPGFIGLICILPVNIW